MRPTPELKTHLRKPRRKKGEKKNKISPGENLL